MSLHHMVVPMQPYCGPPLIIRDLIVPNIPVTPPRNFLIRTNRGVSRVTRPGQRASYFDRGSILRALLSNCQVEGLQAVFAESLVEAILAALETYIKYIVVSSIELCEHRTAFHVANDERYVFKHDMRNSMRFLNDLEVADYGASSDEDSTQNRRRFMANVMSRKQMNNVQLESANNTALNAIGPRKRTATGEAAASTIVPKFTIRCKRINVRDVMAFMKKEKRYTNSNMLFEAHLKYKL